MSKNRITKSRSSWEEYFMKIAIQVASRSTCNRNNVGAVVVRDRTILSTGYNGSIKGLEHCDDVGHLIVNGHCIRTVHAEANSIAQAAKNGINCDGAEIYVTSNPCWNCFKLLINAGIKKINFNHLYNDDQRIFEFAKKANIEMNHIDFQDL